MSTLKTNNLQLLDQSRNIAVSKISEMNGGFSFRNKIIDGRFDFWYEATSATYAHAAGYGAETLVWNGTSADTMVVTQQPVTLGEIPTAPSIQNWSKNVVTSVVGSTSYATKKFRIEDVRTLAGKTVTFSFYAKADAVRRVAVEFIQAFGIGGSTALTGISPTIITLSTTAARYSVTITLPSIVGMTIGTGSDLEINFWMDSGTNTASRSASLGQQSGTFYFTGIQLEEGSVMTPFEELPIELNQMRLGRYFQLLTSFNVNYCSVENVRCDSTTSATGIIKMAYPMRTIPTMTYSGGSLSLSGVAVTGSALSTNPAGTYNLDRIVLTFATAGSLVAGSMFTLQISGGTYIKFDARL